MTKEDLKGWIEGEYDQEGNPVIPEAEYIWFMHDRFFSHPEPRLSHWLAATISTHNEYAKEEGSRIRWFWRAVEEVPEEPDIPRYRSSGERMRTHEEEE